MTAAGENARQPSSGQRFRRYARAFAAAVAVCALVLVALLALFLVCAIENQPLVQRGQAIAPATIEQAKRLLANNDPRRLRRGERRTAEVPASLLDEGVNHVASRLVRGRAAFVLGEDSGELRLSLPLAFFGDTHYLNLRAMLRQAEGEPQLGGGSIGPFALPATIVECLVAAGVRLSGFSSEWQLARQSIRSLVFDRSRRVVRIAYVWEPGLLREAVALAFPPDDVRLLRAAQYDLAALLDHFAPRVPVPLAYVLPAMVSRNGTATPAEARAALLVLASFLAEKPLAMLLPEASRWPRIRPVRLTLRGRYDSAQHFVVSAALAAWAGEPAANAIGLFKEVADARGGSGFSFADLAADRAGTRFGELVATDLPRVHEALHGSLTDEDLAPPLAGLPEHLSAAAFESRFGGRDNAAFQQVTTIIEQRLALLPLYGNASGERLLLPPNAATGEQEPGVGSQLGDQ